MGQVTTSFFADSASAEAAIARLEQKYAALEARIKAVGQQRETPADRLGEWATKLGQVALAYSGLTSVIGLVAQAQNDLNRKTDEAVLKYDDLNRRLRVQGGLSAVQGQEAQQRLVQIALRTGTDYATAARGAEELASQGFGSAEATGPVLERLLQTMQGTGANPSDIKAQANAYVALLSGTGQERTAENMDELTRAIQRLYKAGPVQASDLEQLAPKIQGIAANVPWKEALAQFAVMREKSSADVASTGLKQFWERLQTVSEDQQGTMWLGRMGLKPQDVDAIGETPAQVLDRLAAAVDKLKPEERQPALMQLFGREAMSQAAGLLRDRAKVQEYLGEMENERGFLDDARTRTQGPAAARERAKLIEEQQMLGKNKNWEEMVQAAELLNREAGVPEWVLKMRRGRAWFRQATGSESFEDVAGMYTDPAEMQLPIWQRSGNTLPPELLRAKVAELRGTLPGGVTAQEFLAAAGEGLSGDRQLSAQRAALDRVESGEQMVPLAEKQLAATEEQTDVLREFLNDLRKNPRRNGGEE